MTHEPLRQRQHLRQVAVGAAQARARELDEHVHVGFLAGREQVERREAVGAVLAALLGEREDDDGQPWRRGCDGRFCAGGERAGAGAGAAAEDEGEREPECARSKKSKSTRPKRGQSSADAGRPEADYAY